MTKEVLKPTVSEISNELHESLKKGGFVFQELLRSTSTWDKHQARIQAKYKDLKGSEKQIAWAKKIREEKTELLLIGNVSNIWDMNAQKRGERGFGVKMTEKEQLGMLKAREKEFGFLFSEFAATIIDNRF